MTEAWAVAANEAHTDNYQGVLGISQAADFRV